MLLVLLVTISIVLVLYFAGGSQSYVGTVIRSKKTAKTVIETVNLTAVHRFLQQYAIASDGKFPASADKLAREAGLPRDYLLSPKRPKDPHLYVYIAGQNEMMPKSNVLIYQAAPAPDGKCKTLLLGGQVEMLSQAQLQAAIERTRKSLRR